MSKKPKLPPIYQNHPDEGKRVRVNEDVTIANGDVVKMGSLGTVRWIEPGAEVNCYLVKLDGDDTDTLYERGIRGFLKAQLDFID